MIKKLMVASALVSSMMASPVSAETKTSWSTFTDALGELETLVTDAPMPATDQVRAEGYRHLARLLSTQLARVFESSDPDFPRLTRMPNSIARIGWDNPDNVYLSAPVRGDHTYRIRGNVGTVNFISFNVYDGFVGKDGKGNVRSVGGIDRASLKTDEHGNYELILSPEPHSGNWIKLSPNAQMLTIRQVFDDWEAERQGPLELVNLTTQGTYPKPFKADALAQQFQRVVSGVAELRSFFNQNHSRLFLKDSSVNSVTAPSNRGVGLGMDDPQNNVSAGHFKIGPDEALILTVPASKCAYTNIQLANLWWESLDYVNHQSHLNSSMTRIDADGKTRYVISQKDPGVPNWLDTVGSGEGTLFMRWTRCTEVPAAVESQVVKLSDVRSVLPGDTAVISAEQRKMAIDLRQRVMSRRMAGGS